MFEYVARQIKQAIVGRGPARKLQVQKILKILLGITGELQIDAGDALSISLCHANFQQTQRRLNQGMPA